MKKSLELFRIELLLYTRDFSGFFFTFVLPSLMLLLYGSVYGNDPTPYFQGQGAMDVSVPAYSAMIISVTGLMALPLTFSTCKERKIYKRFDATPLGKGRVICAQTLVNFYMAILGFFLLLFVGKAVYNIRIPGHWTAIAGALLLSISAIFSLGFLFAALAPNIKITNLLCYVSYFVMIFLSGSTVPKELFPEALKTAAQILPLTHVVHILQGTFRGAPLREYQTSVLLLALVFLFCTAAGSFLFRRKSWV